MASRANNQAHYAKHGAKLRAKSKARYAAGGLAKAQKKRGLPEPTRPCPAECEICKQPFTSKARLDHDHATGKFRGWLCNRCNLAVGLLGDTAESLWNALEYLTKP